MVVIYLGFTIAGVIWWPTKMSGIKRFIYKDTPSYIGNTTLGVKLHQNYGVDWNFKMLHV